jgi:hypothetical protein
MNHRLLEAYLDYSGEQARAGIIDDSLTENIDDDRPLEERIADILRAAGRHPDDWNQSSNDESAWWTLRWDASKSERFVRRVPYQPRMEGRMMRPSVAVTHGRDWATPILTGTAG